MVVSHATWAMGGKWLDLFRGEKGPEEESHQTDGQFLNCPDGGPTPQYFRYQRLNATMRAYSSYLTRLRTEAIGLDRGIVAETGERAPAQPEVPDFCAPLHLGLSALTVPGRPLPSAGRPSIHPSLTSGGPVAPATSRPNIVFILSDDHAAHAISAYGSHVNTTTNLDRIAEDGARLDAMYCTNSICTPSRASILTGTYSHVNGAATIYTEFDHRVPTSPEALQGVGYRTGLFGKWHLGESEDALPRGVDDWRIYPGQGAYWDPEMIGPDGHGVVEGYATDTITDMALDWLDTQRAEHPEQPVFLMLHHKAPHRPWVPHPRHSDLYPLGSIPEPDTLLEDLSTRSRAIQGVKMSVADDLTAHDVKAELPAELRGDDAREARASWNYQRYMRDYLQTIQSIDDNVGRVLDHLDAVGIAEDTIVVYTSDQGFFLGDHGWFDKRLMYDESLQMPMLVRWPAQIPPGTKVGEMLTNVDVAATLLDAAGLDPDEALPGQQGRSFVPLLRGEEIADWPTAVYYRYWEHDDPEHHAPAHYGIRTERWKYIDYYGDGLEAPGASSRIFEREYELYDLQADPQELHNLADDPAVSEVLTELRERLAALQAEVGDQPYTGPGSWHPQWNTASRQQHSGGQEPTIAADDPSAVR